MRVRVDWGVAMTDLDLDLNLVFSLNLYLYLNPAKGEVK